MNKLVNQYEKNTKGITLIALVITIVILLILAGISIASLTGNGLFEKAQLAEEKTKNAQEEENEKISSYEGEIDKLLGTRDNNTMKDFYVEISDIQSEQATINIQKTTDVIKTYVVFIDGQYKVTSADNVITVKELQGKHNYTVIVVAIDENYNSKKSATTFTTSDVTFLYKDGVEDIIFTGNSGYESTTEKRSNGLYLNCYDPSSRYTCGASFITEMFDATNYNSVSVEFEELTSNTDKFDYWVRIYSSSGTILYTQKFNGNYTGIEKKIITCDLSSINENVKVAFGISSAPLELCDAANWSQANPYTGTATALITSVYLGV